MLEIEREILDVVKALIPLLERLLVDRPQARVALAAEVGDEMSADEATGAANEDFEHGK